MIKNIEFTHKHSGETYTVFAEYIDESPVTLNKYEASCPEDFTGEKEILDVVVIDKSGQEVDSTFVTNEVVWKEIDTCKNCLDDVRLDTTGLTYFDLWTEGEGYYE
ncbi:hypothetical protein VP14_221 [Vibrio phage VPMCC14]|nr:hypothetical protein VP14_221 [Vibrio phage VPMCC14]